MIDVEIASGEGIIVEGEKMEEPLANYTKHAIFHQQIETSRTFTKLSISWTQTYIHCLLIESADFDPQLICFSPLFKAQRSQKLLDRPVKQFIFE